MAKTRTSFKSNPQTTVEIVRSRSLPLAEAGLRTVMDIARYELEVACDVSRGVISNQSATAIATSVGKALKAIEFQLKHGPKDEVQLLLK